jgi:hypothetical protein
LKAYVGSGLYSDVYEGIWIWEMKKSLSNQWHT